MPKVKEYKDKAKEWRLKVIADNNEVIDDTHEGYKNKSDMIDSKVTASIEILRKYQKRLSMKQLGQLHRIVFNEDELK